MNLSRIDNLNAFSLLESNWDELWQASGLCNPNVRAAPLRAACERFFDGRIRFYVLQDESGKWIAAIPFVFSNSSRNSIQVPNNEWGLWGDLLIRADADPRHVIQTFAGAIMADWNHQIRLPLVDTHEDRWQHFADCCKIKRKVDCSEGFAVGVIQHDGNWTSFENRLSKGFRKKLRKYEKGLRKFGELTIEFIDSFKAEEVEAVFQSAFAVEKQSWKHQQNSTLRADNQYEFFLQQAKLHAASGSLVIGILKLNGEPVAFDFGVIGKGTYFSWKVGFAQRLAKFAPGQLLSREMTRQFHRHGICHRQDTVGPVSIATARWSSQFLKRANILVSGSSWLQLLAFSTLRIARILKRRWCRGADWPQPGMRPKVDRTQIKGSKIDTAVESGVAEVVTV